MTIEEVKEKLKTVDKFEYTANDGKTYIIGKTEKGYSIIKKEAIQWTMIERTKKTKAS